MSRSPGLPRQDYMLSYWLQHARASDLIGYRSSSALPAQADCVVIGAGMSGVMTSYFLMNDPKSPYAGKQDSVILLEARELCHGATGRNGGHCRPDTFSVYGPWKQRYGADEALALVRLEAETLDLVTQLSETEGIDCELWRGRCLEVFCDPKAVDEARHSMEEYQNDGGAYGNLKWHEGVEAKAMSRVQGALACISYDAGQMYPFKLAEGLLKKALGHGLNYQSTTGVNEVLLTEDGQWLVETPRGSIKTKKVVLCTNAWSSTLLPELDGYVVPRREHCSSIVPTQAFSGPQTLKQTQIVIDGDMTEMVDGQFGLNSNYIIQRPRDGIIIMGGSTSVDKDRMYNTDDSKTADEMENALRGFAKQTWVGWGEEKPGEGTSHVWCGILGMSPDNLPWVGPIKRGCYTNLGHSGHGMARIARTSQGLAKLILSESDDFADSGLPKSLAYSKQRLASLERF